MPLDDQEGHLKEQLQEETDDVGAQECPLHLHLALFLQAILELLKLDLIEQLCNVVAITGLLRLLLVLELFVLVHQVEDVGQAVEPLVLNLFEPLQCNAVSIGTRLELLLLETEFLLLVQQVEDVGQV